MKIKLYIEGGGDSALQDTLFRQGWQCFFEKAGLKGKMPSTFRGSGRTQTFDAYRIAVRTQKANELPMLLVDSEDLVDSADSVWEHLQKRDGWERPEGAGAEDAFLMVCVMETWFLADRVALQSFFHKCWNDRASPKWPDLESVPKESVLDALLRATATCGKKVYSNRSKGKLSFELLKEINPTTVEANCPAA
ncbi:MAG: DUF4276 family protein, partial [Verrucomicrobiales bacterium]